MNAQVLEDLKEIAAEMALQATKLKSIVDGNVTGADEAREILREFGVDNEYEDVTYLVDGVIECWPVDVRTVVRPTGRKTRYAKFALQERGTVTLSWVPGESQVGDLLLTLTTFAAVVVLDAWEYPGLRFIALWFDEEG